MLTIAEVSTQLRVSRGTVYALIKADVLPAVRIGHQLRIPERVLANFLEVSGTRKAPPPPEAA